MAVKRRKLTFEIDTHNPFEQKLDAAKAMGNIQKIDEASITRKFRSSQDPINYAFEAIEDISVSELAVDFVRETFEDAIEFISRICK